MAQLKNYVKDNRSGVITEIIKHKPPGTKAKGVFKAELINVETGNVDIEVHSENAIMDWIGKAAYNMAYFKAMQHVSGSFSTTVPPFYQIWLSDWDKEESIYCPMVLGRSIGQANRASEYVGTSTTQGTINKAETRKYINNEGKLVYSHVFDWPTHAANGTFKSVFWSPYENVASTSSAAAGELWFTPASLPVEFRQYMNTGNTVWAMAYDYVNDVINIIGYSSATSSSLPTNPYPGTSVLFTVKRKTGEVLSEVTLRDSDGNPITMYTGYTGLHSIRGAASSEDYPLNFKKLKDGRIVSAFFNGTVFKFRTFNNEGVQVGSNSIDKSEIIDANGVALSIACDDYWRECFDITLDGDILVYGWFRQTNGDVDNVIVVLDPFTGTVKQIIGVNSRLYIHPHVQTPRQVKWRKTNDPTSRGKHVTTFKIAYRNPEDTSDRVYDIVMQTSDINDIKYLAYGNRGTGTLQDSDITLTETSITSSSALWQSMPKHGLPSAHTLLAAPVTKTQSHTMKVTYEFIVDSVESMNYDLYFNTNNGGGE